MNSDLKIIKKKYGENFSKLCRKLFPSILENEGELVSIITSLFKENHFLYDDLITYELAERIARGAEIPEDEIPKILKDNPEKILKKHGLI